MSTTSKSPRKVALVALDVGKDALPAYCHRFSPKVFTQPQLFACLVLKEFFKADYRGILADTPSLCDAIGLKKVPHWTTLQKASQRLLCNAAVQKLLDATVTRTGPRRRSPRRPRVKRAAIDSSGFEAHHTSHYFVRRRDDLAGLGRRSRARTRTRELTLATGVSSVESTRTEYSGANRCSWAGFIVHPPVQRP